MQFRSVKGYSGPAQIGFLLVFIGLGLILGSLAQYLIFLKIVPAGTELANMESAMLKAMKDPANVGYARLAQVAGTFFILFVPAVLFSWIVNGKRWFWLGFNRYLNWQSVALGFGMIFCANMMASPLADVSKSIVAHFPSLNASALRMENAYNDQVLALSNLSSWTEYLVAIFIMAFFPAMFEEMFFRGVMQNLLVRWWKLPWLGILVTSLLFSFIHGSIYLFLSRAVLGIVLGLMYEQTKNIWVNIVAHFLTNFLALTQLFVMSRQHQKIEVDKIDPKIDSWVGLAAMALLMGLFYLLKKYSADNRLRIDHKSRVLETTDNDRNPFFQNENPDRGV
ncbi:MAG TPA: type II CAAX endopeptidase family protein [Ferruginibacter sp.]|nr:type II CAAX endopeptidase family protein [Ferruginibacter sp.]